MSTHRILRLIRPVALGVIFTVIVIVLLLTLAGKFHKKISPDAPPLTTPPVTNDMTTAAAHRIELPAIETAVGSIRAVHETTIAAKITARILQMNAQAGRQVHKGDLLVQLDDMDLKARLQQADAALLAAEAQQAQAALDVKRLSQLIDSGAASQQEYDQAATKLKYADADAQRLRDAISEAKAELSYATITAPIDGTIVDKRADVGDTALPGQVLLTLYDPRKMQLVATVRESLAHQLKIGQTLAIHVEVLNKNVQAVISEIVPEAQSASRTFQVKLTSPDLAGIYPGMFGRLLIPTGTEHVLVIPASAVIRVGQIELVDRVVDKQLHRRAIRTGRAIGNDIEILSGLEPDDQVVTHTAN